MSSGEGMITPIRDPVYVMRKGVLEEVDAGVADKRMLLDEREFSQVLRVMRREGNVIKSMVRDAWDCREVIGTLTKHNRTKATKAVTSRSSVTSRRTSCGTSSIRPKRPTASPTAFSRLVGAAAAAPRRGASPDHLDELGGRPGRRPTPPARASGWR